MVFFRRVKQEENRALPCDLAIRGRMRGMALEYRGDRIGGGHPCIGDFSEGIIDVGCTSRCREVASDISGQCSDKDTGDGGSN